MVIFIKNGLFHRESGLTKNSPSFTPVDLFYIVALLAIAFKLAYSPYRVVDIMLADESYYLSVAQHFQFHHLFRDGFVYFLWLKGWLFFIPDMVTLYFVNYGVLIFVNPLLCYFLAKKVGKEPFLAFMLALFFLVSTVNVFTWPFITRFAVMIVLITLLVVVQCTSQVGRLFASASGLLFVVYTRPEFLLSFILFVLLTLGVALFYMSASQRRAFRSVLLFLVVALVWVTFVRNPVSPGRSLMAFGQHYGANLVEREKIKLNPWTQWQNIMTLKFGPSKSAFQAFRYNPGEALKHMTVNLKKTVPIFYYQLFPFQSSTWPRVVKKIFSFALIFVFGLTLFGFFKHVRNTYKSNQKGRWFTRLMSIEEMFYSALVLLIFLPAAASLIVVFPRTHYILVAFAMMVVFMVRYFPALPVMPSLFAGVKIVLVAGLVWLSPWVASGKMGLLPGHIKPVCTTATRILAVKQLQFSQPVRLLYDLYENSFNDLYFQMFLRSNNTQQYTFFHPDGELTECIRREHINLVYVNSKLLAHTPGKMAFSPSVLAEWRRVELPGCREYLLVHKTLF